VHVTSPLRFLVTAALALGALAGSDRAAAAAQPEGPYTVLTRDGRGR